MTPKPAAAKKSSRAPRPKGIRYVFTSESVTEGHPDKECDYVSDSVLDACLGRDRGSRVACEVLCKEGNLVLAGEITTAGTPDFEAIARQAIGDIGYNHPGEPFCADTVRITRFLTRQAREIAQGVEGGGTPGRDQGAGSTRICQNPSWTAR